MDIQKRLVELATHAGRAISLLALLSVAACDEGTPESGDDGGGEGAGATFDAGPAASDFGGSITGDDRSVMEVQGGGIDKVDVLFVVDDSGSMQEEQQALAAQLPRMMRILASGDIDESGDADFPPVQSLHLGVVSTNMGVPVEGLPDGLNAIPPSATSCVSPGDDGVLRFPNACGGRAEDGDFLDFQAGDDVTTLGANVACLTQLGTRGCGQEQQLDAMLKALTYDPDIAFQDGSPGHGGPVGSGGANAGFLRENAVLAVVLITDEEDCSLPDENAAIMSFAASGSTELTDTTTGQPIELDLATPINVRCGTYPEALHPIDRYVEGLRGLKPADPDLVLFSAIVGVPVKLEGQSADDILAAPEMEFALAYENDPFNPQNTPVPSCSRDHDNDPATPTQDAYPPRRIVELAGRLGDNGTVRSICQDDFTSAMDAVIRKISTKLRGVCLPRSMERDGNGLLGCDVVELIPDTQGEGTRLCDEAKGREAIGMRTAQDGSSGESLDYVACRVNQVVVKDGALAPNPAAPELGVLGWYYDDFSQEVLDTCPANPHRISFTPGADAARGSTIRLECD